MPAEDKRALTAQLLEQMSAGDSAIHEALLDELDRRMDEYRKDPSKLTTFEEIRDRILSRRKRA